MSYDVNNIFARILRGEIPCKSIYKDDTVLAFHDIAPKAPVHILVIPTGEYMNFHDFHNNASAAEIQNFYEVLKKLIIQFGLEESGYRVISNFGHDGGQEVPHYHVHLLGGKVLGPMLSS